MPIYEYQCQDCGHRFEVVMTIHEREKAKRPPCPKCRSTKVEQRLTPIHVVTGSKA